MSSTIVVFQIAYEVLKRKIVHKKTFVEIMMDMINETLTTIIKQIDNETTLLRS